MVRLSHDGSAGAQGMPRRKDSSVSADVDNDASGGGGDVFAVYFTSMIGYDDKLFLVN